MEEYTFPYSLKLRLSVVKEYTLHFNLKVIHSLKLTYSIPYRPTALQAYGQLTQTGPQGLHLCKNYICAASRNTRDRIMLIRAKHRTIV